jgi:undecaprenyl diphosphate synthase
LKEVHAKRYQISAIGNIAGCSPDVQAEIDRAMEITAANRGMVMSVALNYGGVPRSSSRANGLQNTNSKTAERLTI